MVTVDNTVHSPIEWCCQTAQQDNGWDGEGHAQGKELAGNFFGERTSPRRSTFSTTVQQKASLARCPIKLGMAASQPCFICAPLGV
jgi:hypothetical protein